MYELALPVDVGGGLGWIPRNALTSSVQFLRLVVASFQHGGKMVAFPLPMLFSQLPKLHKLAPASSTSAFMVSAIHTPQLNTCHPHPARSLFCLSHSYILAPTFPYICRLI